MNADRVGTSCAERAISGTSHGGMVLINLQQTQHDALCTLRIYASIDDVMAGLATQLGIDKAVALACQKMYTAPPGLCPSLPDDVFQVPYCRETGRRIDGAKQRLDLQEGAKVRLTGGMYAGDVGVVLGKNRDGHYRVQLMHKASKTSKTKVPFTRLLGSWWP